MRNVMYAIGRTPKRNLCMCVGLTKIIIVLYSSGVFLFFHSAMKHVLKLEQFLSVWCDDVND